VIRPTPPTESSRAIIAAPELAAWAESAFLDPNSRTYNEDHDHLEFARILWRWAFPANVRQGRAVAGTAEIPRPPQTGGAWGRAAYWQQVAEFALAAGIEGDPDFVITIHAPTFAEMSDVEACALVEHELYHCGQELDEFGSPRFRVGSGFPAFAIRGHDIEEFSGVALRYGAVSEDLRNLASALNSQASRLTAAAISFSCGTCRAA